MRLLSDPTWNRSSEAASLGAGRVNPPNHIPGVVGHQQRSVRQDSQTARTTIDFARVVGANESGQKVLHLSRGPAAGKRQEYDLVTGQLGAVPRAVLAHERAAL